MFEELAPDRIEANIRMKMIDLMRHFCATKSVEDLTKSVQWLYKSKTVKGLQDKSTLFYLKPICELLEMVELEEKGNLKEWNLHNW